MRLIQERAQVTMAMMGMQVNDDALSGSGEYLMCDVVG